MVGTRVLGYGKSILSRWIQTLQLKLNKFDLTKLNHKKVDYKLFTEGENKFEYELPNSQRLEFKLLTHKDERNIDNEELEKLSKITDPH